MKDISWGGVHVGSGEDGSGGGNAGQISLMQLGLTGTEGAALGWTSRGLCSDVPDEERDDWFQDLPSVDDLKGRGPGLTESERRTVRAKAICQVCPVRDECLSYAMESREVYGVWGGLDAKERARLGGWSVTHVGSNGRIDSGQRQIDDWQVLYQMRKKNEKTIPVESRAPVVGEGGRQGGPGGNKRPDGLCLSGKHAWVPQNIRREEGKFICRLCDNARAAESRARMKAQDPVANGKVALKKHQWSMEEIILEATKLMEAGLSFNETAEKLGIRRDSLKRQFQRWNKRLREGLPPSSPKRQPRQYDDGLTTQQRRNNQNRLRDARRKLAKGVAPDLLTAREREALKWAALHGQGNEKEDMKWAT